MKSNKAKAQRAVKRQERVAKVSDALGLPGDVILDLPCISFEGDKRLHCDNHKGVIEYSQSCLRFRTSRGEIRVEGENMVLRDFGSDILTVEGKIKSMSFL